MRRSWKYLGGSSLLSLVIASLVFPSAVAAQELTLPSSTVITAEPGTEVELGRIPVEDRAGEECVWSTSVTNQESVHLGNRIVVRTGTSELALDGIEDAPGKVTSAEGSVFLADEVVVVLVMGPDGIFSGGLDLAINYDKCAPVPSTTSVPPEVEPSTTEQPPSGPSTTEQPPSVSPTTAPPPAGPTLPATGSEGRLTSAIGLAVVTLGALFLLLARWPRRAR